MQADRSLARERRSREAIEMELAKFREYCQSQVFKRRFFLYICEFLSLFIIIDIAGN